MGSTSTSPTSSPRRQPTPACMCSTWVVTCSRRYPPAMPFS
jgi:hypothetical protein